MNPELTVTKLGGLDRGKQSYFTNFPVTIGADPGCDVRFDPTWDKTVASRHCIVNHQAGQWWLEDVGSRDGTFLNAQRVTRTPLSPGCVVQLGKDGPSIRLEYSVAPMSATPQMQPGQPQPQPAPGYYPQAPANPYQPQPQQGYVAPVQPGKKPGKLNAIAILTLISGIFNALGAIGWIVAGLSYFVFGIIFTIIPAIYVGTLAVFEIIYASKILGDPIRAQKPAGYVAIMEIVSILTGNIFSLIVGILALVFYGDPAVKAAFGRQPQA